MQDNYLCEITYAKKEFSGKSYFNKQQYTYVSMKE